MALPLCTGAGSSADSAGAQIDPESGMVYNISDLKRDMDTAVLQRFDHKNLQDDPHFASGLVPSTTENLAVVIWDALQAQLPPGLLSEVRLFETEKNVVIYRGESDDSET